MLEIKQDDDGASSAAAAVKSIIPKGLDYEEKMAYKVKKQIELANSQLHKPIKIPKAIKSLVRIWPTEPKEHFAFKYSWLPQPMLHKAATKLYLASSPGTSPLLSDQ